MGRLAKQTNALGIDESTMSFENFLRILQFLKASHIPVISLMGGEPTLHPNFIKLVRMGIEQGLYVSIKSNATWNETIQRDIDLLPDEGIHFLLNINPQSVIGKYLWKRVVSNAGRLKGRHLDFQLNITHPDLEYRYLLDLADEIHPGKIVWSLSNLTIGGTSASFSDPLLIREQYSKRILAFVTEAGKRGIQTEGVHGVTPCMFTKQDYLELLANRGKLVSTCTPVFDFLPDLSVRSCFPLSDFWDSKFIYNYHDLQEINMEFLETLVIMRSDFYPLEACFNCEYSKLELCHGGCLASHLDNIKSDRTDPHFLDRIPVLRMKYRIRKELSDPSSGATGGHFLIDTLSGEKYEIDQYLYLFLVSVNGERTLGSLFQDAFARFDGNSAAQNFFRYIVLQLAKREVIAFKPFHKKNLPMIVSRERSTA